MSKTRDTGFLANVIQVHDTGVRIMSGSEMLMAISSSGQVTITGELSGSDAANSLLLSGTGSVGFTTTSSFLAVSSSQQEVSASYIALSGSYNTFSGSASTRITENSSSIQQVSSSQQQISSSLLQVSASYIALSGSYTTFSGSASTRITVDSASLLQVSASQQQISASLLNVISIFATTGSNSFRANQSITGSLVVSSTITAQTLVVQTVTSSIIYSSGSNVFGCDLNSRQTFTGSVLITGSLTIAGASSAASYSGTTIYGSTAVCSPVGKFTSCIDAGTGTFSGALSGTCATFSNLITVSGFGTSNFSSGGTGYNKLVLRNTTAGVANGAQLSVGTDADADQLYILSFATTYTTSGMNIAGGAVINGEGPGGLSIAATQSNIGFYTNGAAAGNLRMTIASTGTVTFACDVEFGSMTIFNGSAAGTKTITTSAVTLQATSQYGGGNTGNLSLVSGIIQGNGGIGFVDVVLWMYGGSTPTVISSQTTGSPAGRTYSISASANLQLTMASGTYFVSSNTFRQSYTN